MVPSVSVPVLSVHRISMLPRFSIASSRRTMTPRRAMARAPAERVTLTIIGNSSGDIPTASATANKRDSINGRWRSRFTVRTNRTMTTIARIRRYPNWRTPRAKSVSGGRARSRAAIAPNAVRRPVSTARTFAVPLWTEAPRKTALVRAESTASGFTIPGFFSTGNTRLSCSLR